VAVRIGGDSTLGGEMSSPQRSDVSSTTNTSGSPTHVSGSPPIIHDLSMKVKRLGSYTVKTGDTLESIASTYGTTSRYLAKTNGITNPNEVEVGMRLNLNNADLSAQYMGSPGMGDPARKGRLNGALEAISGLID